MKMHIDRKRPLGTQYNTPIFSIYLTINQIVLRTDCDAWNLNIDNETVHLNYYRAYA